ncbi:16759_t:CDS:2 [Racocetra fulgida]|uniref:Histone H1 n=1 Tax=Racocetra fulgida TaxID=60492 RepID=A0A9N9BUE7_9GLOM|nr:16759_t:CDS:2 [Racocetra fulgida]
MSAKASTKRPTYEEMIREAIIVLKDRKGSSRQAIKKYIANTYNIEDNVTLTQSFRRALNKGVEKGLFEFYSGPKVEKSPTVTKATKAAEPSKKTKVNVSKPKTTKKASVAKKTPAEKAKKRVSKRGAVKRTAAAKSSKKSTAAKRPKRSTTTRSRRK